jgi:MFS family permease
MTRDPATSSSSAPNGERFPVKTWLIAFAGWTFDFYDLVLFSFLLLPLSNELHLSVSEQAWLLGVALGGSGVGGILFGYLSDVYGRRRVMMWTICLYSLGTALSAAATGPWTLLAFRLLTGLGIGGEWAVGHALLAEGAPHHMRGRASALLQAGEPVGVALAAIMGMLGAPLLGWRAVFLISSASAALALVVRRHLPESALWDRQRERALSPVSALRRLARAGLLGVMVKSWLLGVLKLGTYWTCYTWLPKLLPQQLGQPVVRCLGQGVAISAPPPAAIVATPATRRPEPADGFICGCATRSAGGTPVPGDTACGDAGSAASAFCAASKASQSAMCFCTSARSLSPAPGVLRRYSRNRTMASSLRLFCS